jgi:hypothetical protein
VGVVDGSYTRFAYRYAPSAETAFERECRNYDDFGRSGALDNEAPPVRTRSMRRNRAAPDAAPPSVPSN